jgi:hypothetical protein
MRVPMIPATPARTAALLALALLPAATAFGQGAFAQTLEAFHTPAAVVVAEDGRTLFISNAARSEFGMVAGRGAISRVRLGDDGQLRVESARFVSGLNAPLGLAILPGPLGSIPEGALVVAVGCSWTVDDKGRTIEPGDAGTGLAFFDGVVFAGRGCPLLRDQRRHR